MVLERHAAQIKTVRHARKAPFTDDDVRELLRAVSTVVIGRGRRSETRSADELTSADLKGPTGNYRSPMVRKGKTLLVGFVPEALESLL